MLDGIPLNVGDVGPWGLLIAFVALVVVGLLRGNLVPRSVAEMWLKAWETEKASRAEQDKQIDEMLEHSRTTVTLLSAIRAEADRKREDRE